MAHSVDIEALALDKASYQERTPCKGVVKPSEAYSVYPDKATVKEWKEAGFMVLSEDGSITVFGPPVYEKYIHSKFWQQKRRYAFAHWDKVCFECGATSGSFQVHHLHYKTLGREDVAEDLRIVCTECHPEIDDRRRYDKGLQTWARKSYGYNWKSKYTLSVMETMFDMWIAKKKGKVSK